MTASMQVVTVGVRDVAHALELFRDVMGLEVELDEQLGDDRARLWGVEAGRRIVELSCDGHPVGRLRLVEWPDAPGAVRADEEGGPDAATAIGPKAIDFYVHHGMDRAVEELAGAGYQLRSAPVRYSIGGTGDDAREQEEVLVTGPDGLPMLFMVGLHHPPTSLRPPVPGARYSEVATVSVITDDVEASVKFYTAVLGMSAGPVADVSAQLLESTNRLVGVAPGTPMRYGIVNNPPEPSGKYLLVSFGNRTRPRLTARMRPGMLGVCLYSHEVDGLDRRLAAAGPGSVVGGPSVVATAAGEQRVALVRGPNEELFELSERG